jgi:multiple sugar transport system substrate-binding protein
MKFSTRIAVLLLILAVPAACSGKPEADTSLSGTLKIVYVDEAAFYNEYGQFFNQEFPNVDFEVISSTEQYQFFRDHPSDSLEKFYDVHEPDIVHLDSILQYAELAESGRLVDLDSLIADDGYGMDTINPDVIDQLRRHGDGKLYALSVKFDNMALYYNIDLFNKHGIEPPRDGMTWDEVFELARRFPTDGEPQERIAGFSGRTQLSSLVMQMAESEGLNLYAGLPGELTIRSDRWRSIMETVVETAKSGAIYVPGVSEITDFNPPNIMQPNLFIAGRSAMTVDNLLLMDRIREMGERSGRTFNYGVVAAPVSGKTGTVGGLYLVDMFGINAHSSQQPLAWEFIKYAAGEEYAKLKSKSSVYLLSRSTFMSDKDGIDLEPFHKIRANPDAKPLLGAHYLVHMAFDQALDRELPKAVAGEQSIDDTIEAIARSLEEAELQIPS